ncbi:substrate-binding domain-containing protein, partial [Endozoicomonas sp.]|uniref:substrate-binding domain-containing protein n=1 Tax=Endozoicomonas sp. TaxID=1892382 RepID=UPI00383B2699
LMAEALDNHPELDGVFCCNDDLAIGAIMECQRRGISVPNQMAVAGFNALDIGQSITPKLASIETPRWEIGSRAATMLLEKLAGSPPKESVVDLGFTLYEGESI